MPNQRFKTENTELLGGINRKASVYLTQKTEFLRLANFDFQTPGALTKRWGTTQYLTQSYTGQINSLTEYTKLDGASYLVFSVSGGLFAGGTQGQFQGLTTPLTTTETLSAFYYRTQQVSGALGWQNAAGFGFRDGSIWTGSSDQFQTFGATNVISKYNSDVFGNVLYMGDGYKFVKLNGTTLSMHGLPPIIGCVPGNDTTAVPFATGTSYALPLTFSYVLYAAYENSRGFVGPISPLATAVVGISLINSTAAGASVFGINARVFVPRGFDITHVNTYVQPFGSGAETSIIGRAFTTADWSADVVKCQRQAVSFSFSAVYSATLTSIFFGISSGSSSVADIVQRFTALQSETVSPLDYPWPPGATTLSSTQTVQFVPTYFAPKYTEVYNNQLFVAGVTGSLSNVYFSEIGEPERFFPEDNFEVRTNDGDSITGLKAFNSNLYIFKNNSFHELSGGDPTNFQLRELTNEYGCLSHRAVADYLNMMLFLDRKGVVRFNGASIENLSIKIQHIFDTMNVEAAKDNATMVHDKDRNQIMLGIPVNGSTVNNLTVVFDYVADAWTTYEGFSPSIYTTIQGTLGKETVVHGGYTGQIFNHGPSLMGDNGSGISCVLQSGFKQELGVSTEKQWRRFYVNVDPVVGSTAFLNLNLYKNYGTSIALSSTMFANPFQSRIDFGLSAKSLSVEIGNFSAIESIRINGYVLAYRFQRDT